MCIIGIDPGKSGAAAHIENGVLVNVYPFKGDIEKCREIHKIEPLVSGPPVYFIERVTASPQMGVVSAFTFGKWAEAVECSARLTEYDVHMVRPVVWQNAIGIYSQGDKGKLYAYAKKLFPRQYEQKMFNKETSDAVLIAFYGWRYMANEGVK